MFLYSLALLLALLLSAPVWGWRMLRQGRYRQGLRERMGGVPQRLTAWIAGRPTVWVHAVSVGETLAAERLVRALEAALPVAPEPVVAPVPVRTPQDHRC